MTWVDRTSYSAHTVPSYGGGLPFPANHYVPMVLSRDTVRRNARSMSGITEDEMLDLLKDCYATLALLLEDGRRYLITEGATSDVPTSLDALVFAHLAFHLRSPMGETLLRPLVWTRSHLYVNDETLIALRVWQSMCRAMNHHP